jgi:hypothetical protein
LPLHCCKEWERNGTVKDLVCQNRKTRKKTLKKSDVANVVKKKNLHKIEIFFSRDSQLSNVYKTPKKDPALAHKNNNIKNKVNCS